MQSQKMDTPKVIALHNTPKSMMIRDFLRISDSFLSVAKVERGFFSHLFPTRKLLFFNRFFDGCLSIARAARLFKRSFQQLVRPSNYRFTLFGMEKCKMWNVWKVVRVRDPPTPTRSSKQVSWKVWKVVRVRDPLPGPPPTRSSGKKFREKCEKHCFL